MSDKKTVVITGVSRGIGHHLAGSFLRAGYRVIGLSRTATEIDSADFEHIRVDVGNIAELYGIKAEIPINSVSGLINNAGMHGPLGPFEENDIHEWVETFNTNLFGAAALTHMCLPGLKRNGGFVIFLSGGGSGFAKPNFSAYGVSKTAVVRLAENLAEELSPDVYVYCMAPGPNRTKMLESAIEAGDQVDDADIVGFESPERLSLFLANNRDIRYSGKFFHVMDDYENWGEEELAHEMYKLRRTK